jgi:ClpP class serine protease
MWFLEPRIKERIEKAEINCLAPTDAQMAVFSAFASGTGGQGSRIRQGGDITISGVLTKKPSFLAWLFGEDNTTYGEIMQAIAEADADPSVEQITMHIDSPGGNVDGFFEAADAIKAAKKPVRAVVQNATSGAYGLASQAGEVIAAGRGTFVGSIGVATTRLISNSVIDIISTDAPKKRPDVRTEEGRAAVVEELDAIHALFADTIARGRGVSVAEINEKYGQGAVLLAEDALARGMIDGIGADAKPKEPAAASTGNNMEATSMESLKQLQAEAPEVYAEAIAAGVQQERTRVANHMMMGESSGAMDIALEAITAGTEMTAEMQAKYLESARSRADEARRAADEAAASEAANSAGSTAAADEGRLVAMVREELGLQ